MVEQVTVNHLALVRIQPGSHLSNKDFNCDASFGGVWYLINMIKDGKIKFAANGLLAGLLLLSGAQTFGQQQAADISQAVSAAIDSAGSDPVSIEALSAQ